VAKGLPFVLILEGRIRQPIEGACARRRPVPGAAPIGCLPVSPMTASRRLASTALMFAIMLVFLAVAAGTHQVWPLFVGWIPLTAVPWLLTRPEVGGSAGDDVVTAGGAEAAAEEDAGAASPGASDAAPELEPGA
jgi:hypothetical protein